MSWLNFIIVEYLSFLLPNNIAIFKKADINLYNVCVRIAQFCYQQLTNFIQSNHKRTFWYHSKFSLILWNMIFVKIYWQNLHKYDKNAILEYCPPKYFFWCVVFVSFSKFVRLLITIFNQHLTILLDCVFGALRPQ